MDAIETAQAVAALWFTVLFGLCLLLPVFRAPCKLARAIRKRREEHKQ